MQLLLLPFKSLNMSFQDLSISQDVVMFKPCNVSGNENDVIHIITFMKSMHLKGKVKSNGEYVFAFL